MLTLTSQYALRATIYLVQHPDDWPIPGRVIAEETEIPRKYLSKILGDLVRAGVLQSSRGKTGGFWLQRSPRKLSLLEVLAPFEPFDKRSCPFGNKLCSEADPCLAHEQWKQVVEAEQSFLQNTSIQQVSVEAPQRRSVPGSRKKKQPRRR